ncbi:MAG: glycoside hydrolase family 5 protein [Ruminococcus sp.]|nr:glycoside hydrolase family 5 protein [Ruminococcus sp.]
MEKIRLEGTRFLNESGKEVLFQGINVLHRERENGHLFPDLEKAFPFFQESGFNLLRLGIFWDGAEPAPGRIDLDYLDRVKDVVQTAERYGIYIMLDMHQDLFAQKFIDGAPDWACLDEGAYHPEQCDIWYEAYLKSEAIIKAADNFWADKPAEDGIGLLRHYEAMWEKIAEVFDDCDNVIGFEPMNEPFMGSLARESFGAATVQMTRKYPAFDMNHPENIPPEQAAEFMALVGERFLEFDRTTLMDFYRRMQKAIRKHSDKPLITGGNIYCSTDVPTGIERLDDGLQIYAPHGYDSVVDSERYESFSKENVERLYQGKRESQERLHLPTIAAEWGAFPSKGFTNDLIAHMNGIIEKNLWGSAYCEYHPGMESDPNFTALRRAYPMETAGILKHYHYDREGRTLTITYDAADDGETVLYLPFVPGSFSADQPFSHREQPVGSGSCLCIVRKETPGEITLGVNA